LPTTIPALPVVVPLAAVAFAALLRRLHRRGGLTPLRTVVAAVLCGYAAGVVANTVFPVLIGTGASGLPWTVFLDLTPLADAEPRDVLRNVVVFVPLGVLLPLVARVRSVGRVVLIGFLVSLAMELVQLLNAVTARGGHIADVDDLLANTVGTPIGYGLLQLALLVPALRRVVDAATWPAARPSRQATSVRASDR
jgi:glycopeptide antibiotics resistance protein